ncbi:hypothetical protein DVJ83_17995 (plasmid) [Deinococcus wulumuqiensis]|uniref:Uncharacterized protein n=1 Tax=Deinococcus wulumuqiensis TaxID=980427 RepID=A0A345IMR8_9DEIO|nr:hypothetical protein [Deinococcus wulumuqiensis]AXH00991.1 hypothetical protein DVJ83_17995 [Deinococcus wulumuqiensis]
MDLAKLQLMESNAFMASGHFDEFGYVVIFPGGGAVIPSSLFEVAGTFKQKPPQEYPVFVYPEQAPGIRVEEGDGPWTRLSPYDDDLEGDGNWEGLLTRTETGVELTLIHPETKTVHSRSQVTFGELITWSEAALEESVFRPVEEGGASGFGNYQLEFVQEGTLLEEQETRRAMAQFLRQHLNAYVVARQRPYLVSQEQHYLVYCPRPDYIYVQASQTLHGLLMNYALLRGISTPR